MIGEEHQLVVAVEVGDLRLQRRAHGDHGRAFRLRVRSDRVEQRVVVEAVLGHVGDVHRRLHRQQEERLQQLALFLVEIGRARRPRLDSSTGCTFEQHATMRCASLSPPARAAFAYFARAASRPTRDRRAPARC